MRDYVVVLFAFVLCASSAYGADRAPRLIEAVKAGNHEAVRALLKQPAELKITERDGPSLGGESRRSRGSSNAGARRGQRKRRHA